MLLPSLKTICFEADPWEDLHGSRGALTQLGASHAKSGQTLPLSGSDLCNRVFIRPQSSDLSGTVRSNVHHAWPSSEQCIHIVPRHSAGTPEVLHLQGWQKRLECSGTWSQATALYATCCNVCQQWRPLLITSLWGGTYYQYAVWIAGQPVCCMQQVALSPWVALLM